MPDRSYDARHRSSRLAAVRRRLLGGLALPAAAATALVLTTTGATVPTGAIAQAGPATHEAQEQSRARAAASSPAALAAARAEAADRAARAAQRQALQVRVARVAALARAAQRKAALRRAALARARAWMLPITHHRVTSGFGHRWGRLHAGNDFAAPIGTRVVAMSSGTVTFAGTQSGYGNIVEIRYWDRTVSYFGHLDRVTAHVGQKVAPGTLVGFSGNTGHSTGPHLHLEIHPRGRGPVDPRPWLLAHGIRP